MKLFPILFFAFFALVQFLWTARGMAWSSGGCPNHIIASITVSLRLLVVRIARFLGLERRLYWRLSCWVECS